MDLQPNKHYFVDGRQSRKVRLMCLGTTSKGSLLAMVEYPATDRAGYLPSVGVITPGRLNDRSTEPKTFYFGLFTNSQGKVQPVVKEEPFSNNALQTAVFVGKFKEEVEVGV